MSTIRCEVVADKVWHSKENRFLAAGDVVEFPAEVKDHTGKLVPFKIGDAFKLVEPEAKQKPAKAAKPADDLV